jgi:hypothetical protein
MTNTKPITRRIRYTYIVDRSNIDKRADMQEIKFLSGGRDLRLASVEKNAKKRNHHRSRLSIEGKLPVWPTQWSDR